MKFNLMLGGTADKRTGAPQVRGRDMQESVCWCLQRGPARSAGWRHSVGAPRRQAWRRPPPQGHPIRVGASGAAAALPPAGGAALIGAATVRRVRRAFLGMQRRRGRAGRQGPARVRRSLGGAGGDTRTRARCTPVTGRRRRRCRRPCPPPPTLQARLAAGPAASGWGGSGDQHSMY